MGLCVQTHNAETGEIGPSPGGCLAAQPVGLHRLPPRGSGTALPARPLPLHRFLVLVGALGRLAVTALVPCASSAQGSGWLAAAAFPLPGRLWGRRRQPRLPSPRGDRHRPFLGPSGRFWRRVPSDQLRQRLDPWGRSWALTVLPAKDQRAIVRLRPLVLVIRPTAPLRCPAAVALAGGVSNRSAGLCEPPRCSPRLHRSASPLLRPSAGPGAALIGPLQRMPAVGRRWPWIALFGASAGAPSGPPQGALPPHLDNE